MVGQQEGRTMTTAQTTTADDFEAGGPPKPGASGDCGTGRVRVIRRDAAAVVVVVDGQHALVIPGRFCT
jgi:hypothetical protein